MNITHLVVRGGLSVLAAGVLLTNGCALPHAPLRHSDIGKVEPANYCPGDTVTASYDLIAPDTCTSHSGLDCATLQPTITTSSSPESFPSHTVTAFANRESFVPTADTVDVSFTLAGTGTTQGVLYPIIDAAGNRTSRSRYIHNNTARTTRINGSGTYDLVFTGVCNGPQPSHAPANLPGPPAFSPNLQLGEICNPTSSPILVSVGGATVMLAPGSCQNPLPPGSTDTIPAGSPVMLLSAPVDPGAQCSSVEGGRPPADLRLQATMRCR